MVSNLNAILEQYKTSLEFGSVLITITVVRHQWP